MSRRFFLIGLIVLVAASLAVGWLISREQERNLKRFKPVWSVTLPERYICGSHYTDGLIILNGIIYCLGTANPYPLQKATLYAIDAASGSTLWKETIEIKEFRSSRHPLIVIADRFACYQTKSGTLRVLDAQTGRELWQFDKISSVLDISDGQIHILDDNWRYTIINAVSGKVQVTTHIQGDLWTQLLLADGHRYLFNEKQLAVTDARTGKLLWTYKPNNFDIHGFKMNAAAEMLYVVADANLMAFDGHTGHKLWQRPHQGIPPVIDGEIAYLGGDKSEGQSVLKLNARTGEQIVDISAGLWTSLEPVIRGGIICSPAYHSHYFDPKLASNLYDDNRAASYDYGLKAIDARTGNILWTTELVWGEYVTKPIFDNGYVYFGVAAVDWSDSSRLLAYPFNPSSAP